jgi:hypothetical protein
MLYARRAADNSHNEEEHHCIIIVNVLSRRSAPVGWYKHSTRTLANLLPSFILTV